MSDSAFGTWLKQRRRALDLTQETLGSRVGYATATIRKIEAGERRPSREVAERLATALELEPDDHTTFMNMARATVTTSQPNAEWISATASDRPTAQLIAAAHAVVPVPVPDVRATHLPVPPTPFVGRAPELAELSRILASPAGRLLNLIGLGGAGKTRLAIEAAAECARLFANGVAFVPLAAIASAAALAPAIADVLACPLYGLDDPREQLLRYLRDRELLLVLDNMEHLLDDRSADAAQVTELLAAILQQAPGVKLLVTSRERLRLQDEWVIEIQGLSLPAEALPSAFDSSTAVALFLQQARKVRSDFVLAAADRPAIVRICQLLEGMPLGIELAAAWVRVLSCAEIAQEIARSLDFLAIAARDLPARHRSLRAVFNHSWELLGEQERQVLRRLSVFRGGFTRAAAEAVCAPMENGTNPGTFNAQFSMLHSLSALIDKSLLHRDASGRYDMHELVRQYAGDKLAADQAEHTSTHDRHCRYYGTWLESRDRVLRSAGQKAAIVEISAEIDNLRQVGDRAIAHSRFAELRPSIRTLGWFYELRGWLREGAAVFERLVAALDLPAAQVDALPERAGFGKTEHALTLGQALAQHGWYCFRQGQLVMAGELLRRSLTLLPRADAPQARADTLAFLGYVCYTTGQYAEARRFLQEGLAISQAIGDDWTATFCQSDLSKLAYLVGEYEQARELCRASLVTWRATGDPRVHVCILTAYAAAARALGDYTQARALLQEALVISAEQRDLWGLGLSLLELGGVVQAQGDHAEAAYMFRESAGLFRETGDQEHMARALNALGSVCYDGGRYAEARGYFREALEISLASQALLIVLEALVGLAGLLADTGAAEIALEAFVYALEHPSSSADLRDRAQRLSMRAIAALTPAQAEAAQRRGRTRTIEALVDVVREPERNDLRRVVQRYLQPSQLHSLLGTEA